MKKFSEYVSLGHPDKIADYISQYILDRFIEVDPMTRYAVEVQIKDSTQFTKFVRAAVNDIGYTVEYQKKWGIENTICGDDLSVAVLISQQSPDIAQGLSGWGDQGIFFGYAEPNADTHYMPRDHAYAKRLCKVLFESGLGGLDIKTQVYCDDDKVTKIIVAIPLLDENTEPIEQLVRETIPGDYEIIVNGTGRYVKHSSIADCGTTGRKLVVDFYGGNCKIGGGSPWTKDFSKADLTLNLYARAIAIEWAKSGYPVEVSIACCIGQSEVEIVVRHAETGSLLFQTPKNVLPFDLARKYNLDAPIFASMCRWGLFGEFQKNKPWEF